MPRKPVGDREVGYGKPPRHSRFEPGQSGNPNGRPKKDTSLAGVIDRVLDRKIVLKENGKVRKVPVIEAVIMRLAEDAMAGKPQAMKQLLKLKEQADSRPKASAQAIPAAVQKLLADLDADTLMKLRNVAKVAQETLTDPESEETNRTG